MDRIIETERLRLRPLRDDDARDIALLINTYDIAKNLARVPFPYALADAEEFLRWLKTCKGQSRFSAICLRSSGDGLQGIISYEWNETKQDVEMGYWLVKDQWGKGLMSEAAKAMVSHAFEVAGVNDMMSCYFNENPASGKVLRRVGFETVGACLQISKAQGKEVPVTNMRLTRERWLGKISVKS